MLKKGCSVEECADRLRSRIIEGTGNAQTDSNFISITQSISQEGLLVESFAKEMGLWIPFSDIIALGTPMPSGVENEVYLNADGNMIYKVNNLMTSKSVMNLLERLKKHNQLFPQTGYTIMGFTGFGNGNVYPVLCQNYIIADREATPIEIDTYMAALGFDKIEEAKYTNGNTEVSDLRPRNVLRDNEGDLFVIDADFK